MKKNITEIGNVLNQEKLIENEIKKLRKKYQDSPDTLLKDYDRFFKDLIVCVIANFNAVRILRDDVVRNFDTLISVRQMIVDNYSNNCSNNNDE